MRDGASSTAEPTPAEPRWKRCALALTLGLASHGVFLLAVALMFLGLHDGLAAGLVRLSGPWRLALDAFLALQFPLVHSAFLTRRGQGWLARALGERHGRTLAPTTYAGLAALQILSTFALWAPSGIVWWEPRGGALAAMNVLYGASWLFLGKALLDGGLGLQTGWIGWTALWRGSRVAYPPLAQRGLFALCRQPIYLGFALTLWTGPVVTPDRLFLATVWSAYCVLGPRHKEQRFLARHGEAFGEYQRRVPYMLPGRRRVA